jgi:hypothetical protein
VNAYSDLISELIFIRFGAELTPSTCDELARDLITFQRALKKTTAETVTEQAIRSWLPKKGKHSDPKRASAMRFLSQYLAWIDEKKQVPDARQSRLQTLDLSLRLYESPVAKNDTNFVAHDAGDQLASLKMRRADPLMVLATQVLIAVSTRNKRSEFDDFFRGADASASNDASYFLMYRYSTTHGNVMKTFLVMQKSNTAVRDSYVFNHFVWPGPGSRNQSFRECEGLLLKLDKAYYLLGYNFQPKVNKRTYLSEYLKKRIAAKLNPNGIGIIAVEYEVIDADYGLIDGITLTLGAHKQPLTSRVTLLHLGTKTSLAVNLNDTVVQPTELEAGTSSLAQVIGQDLLDTVARIKGLDAVRFSDRLEGSFRDKRWGVGLAEEILSRISNTPAWETSDQNPATKTKHRAKYPVSASGAIEVIGKMRP